MAATGKEREERAARERARTYAARQELHRREIGRRRRDNVIAGVAGGVLVLAVAGLQFAYYQAGPGVPAPTGTATPAPGTPSDDTVTPGPVATDPAAPGTAPTP